MKKIAVALLLFAVVVSAGMAQVVAPKWVQTALADSASGKSYEWGTGTSKQMAAANNLARDEAMTKMTRKIAETLDHYLVSFKMEASKEDGEAFERIIESTTRTVTEAIVTENTDVQMDNRNFRVYVLLSMPVKGEVIELKRQLQEKTDLYTRLASNATLLMISNDIKASDKGKGAPAVPPAPTRH